MIKLFPGLIWGLFFLSLEARADQKWLFDALYSRFGLYTLQTAPGTYQTAPLKIAHAVAPPSSGIYYVHGTFSTSPGYGSVAILASFPSFGQGIANLYSNQYFSGFRWQWMMGAGNQLSSIQGGYYDLSAVTIPKVDFSHGYSYSNGIVNLVWTKPSAENYGTKIVVREDIKELSMLDSDEKNTVYSGYDQTCQFLWKSVPGRILNIGFFGMYRLMGQEIDSGSGVQRFINDSGAISVLGGVYQPRDPSHQRSVIRIPVPLIDGAGKHLYRFRPQNAPLPVIPGTTQTMPWPVQTDTYITLKGKFWSVDTDKLMEMKVPDAAILTWSEVDGNIIDESHRRIIDWNTGEIHVSLPPLVLSTETPCVDLHYKVASRKHTGLESNIFLVRVVNANPWYAQNCKN